MMARAIGLWLVLYLSLSLVLKFDPPISRLYGIGSALLAFIVAVVWRFAVLLLIRSTGLATRLTKRVAVLGWSPGAEKLVKLLQGDQEKAYFFVGCVFDGLNVSIQNPPPEWTKLGGLADLKQILRSYEIDILICADASVDLDGMIKICNACDREMVEFKIIPTKFHLVITGLHVENIIDVPVLGVAEGPLERPLNRILKRVIDIIGAIVGLIISVPFILIFGTLVYLVHQQQNLYLIILILVLNM
jgi:FlaA1/EpsC-like NDP-sugar epimerase